MFISQSWSRWEVDKKIQSRQGWILGSFNVKPKIHGYSWLFSQAFLHTTLQSTVLRTACLKFLSKSLFQHRSNRSESEFHAPGSACGGNAEAGNSDDPACNKTSSRHVPTQACWTFRRFHVWKHHMKYITNFLYKKTYYNFCRRIISCPSIYPSNPFGTQGEHQNMSECIKFRPFWCRKQTGSLHDSTGLTLVWNLERIWSAGLW